MLRMSLGPFENYSNNKVLSPFHDHFNIFLQNFKLVHLKKRSTFSVWSLQF